MKDKVCFITVNYNNADLTISFTDSIAKLNNNQIDVFVVIIDNNSEKYDISKLDSLSDEGSIKIIYNENNIGYFPALNVGLREIELSDYDFVVISNNDITFKESFLQELYSIQIDEKLYAIAPNIITLDGKKQNPHIVKQPDFFFKLKWRLYYSNYYIARILELIRRKFKKCIRKEMKASDESPLEIYSGIGACYILTNNWFHLKSLDDRLFLWGEEVLFSNQIKSSNGIIKYFPNLIVTHNESSSTKKITKKSSYLQSKKSYMVYKNEL